MDFYVKEAALDSLTPDFINEFSNGKSRYNCIFDLTLKGELEIKLFIDRINGIYDQLLGVRGLSSNGGQRRIYPYLCIAFSKSENESQENGFPLYDFISFEVISQRGVSSSGLGIMLSTYIHDLDRKMLEQKDYLQGNVSLSVALWNSLFETTPLNNGVAPLAEKYPIFVFPQQNSQIGLKSNTNDYMSELGLSMKLDYTLDGYPMRIFYKHHHNDGYTCTNEVYLAILAIGQVLLEMTRP
ncbi:MAG: hypothetical protein F6K14_06045, partial [Symploca sp. SIO2C1]|nr:hypothetical protein [Symploca sp. SIO2C1]